MTPPRLTAPTLHLAGVSHGFFSRDGGVSSGVYRSLNVGLGSEDDPVAVSQNRERCRQTLNSDVLLTLYQVHSPDVVIVDEPWRGAGPKADAMATTRPGIALGVLTADCMPFLFHDAHAQVIGATHAGWRGALAGVLEATISTMEKLGARPEHITAALGPCLRRDNFEVGLDLVEAFTEKYPYSEQYFSPGVSAEKRQFDLAAFGRSRLEAAGVGVIDDLGFCTLARSDEYFSYRASRRAGEADYGRNLSAITLLP